MVGRPSRKSFKRCDLRSTKTDLAWCFMVTVRDAKKTWRSFSELLTGARADPVEVIKKYSEEECVKELIHDWEIEQECEDSSEESEKKHKGDNAFCDGKSMSGSSSSDDNIPLSIYAGYH
ncbi:hypothetical protein EVAR_84327_1 [Eumeta japonica]|uniref:Uncharacterized protein n=1 Tax=Eumeta variegata TaxID=151549 RepID=A0A4C1U5F4_EUMVA|nr:hypothetical protein EVAR_84327_1 [Eumeta japonica]